jgi:hypothetical protein
VFLFFLIAAPCGTLPYLEFDGIKITASTAISRFLANEFNLAGKNNIEGAEIDAFIETVMDAYTSWLMHVQVNRDPSEKVKFKVFLNCLYLYYYIKIGSC